MANCKKCGEEFHACSSCGFYTNWEYDYCSRKCWHESDEFKKMRKIFDKYFMLLGEKNFNELWGLLGDGDYINIIEDEWIPDLKNILKKIKEEKKW